MTRQKTTTSRRLSRRAYPGLCLALGVVLLIGAAWVFGGIAEDVVNGDPITVTDRNLAECLHRHVTPGMSAAMQVVTGFGAPRWVTAVTIVAGLVLGWKRSWHRLLALVLVVPGGMALLPLLKMAFHRSRPHFEDGLLSFQGYSFPSGHTMAATMLYGLLAVFVVTTFPSTGKRGCAVLGACGMVLLIGFSRLYLGAHYLSDVLGAMAAGLAWLAFSLTALLFRRPADGESRRW